MVSVRDFDFDLDEIDRRKQLIRDLWAGKAVDHVPVLMNVVNPASRYSIREQFQDGDKQLEAALTAVGLTWQKIPESDTVPAMRPDVGCSCLATAFGAELFWGDDPNQTCGVREPVLRDVEEVCHLAVPASDRGQLGEGVERIRRFAAAGAGMISVSLLDMAGGLNVACDLLGGEALYVAMYENPEALLCLLDKIQQLFLGTIVRQVEAAGGQDHITTTDFPDYWFPEGRKGHVSDDISANISLELYRKFSLPFHDMVFARYGGGGLHNCGPNPCLKGYLEHTPRLRAIDLSFHYSKDDLPAIKRACRRQALIYMGEFPSEPQEALDTFRGIMEFMSPDVVVIPVLNVRIEDSPAEFYAAMRTVSEEYAKRMDWGWE